MIDVMFGKEYIVKVTDDGECITVGELIHCKDCDLYGIYEMKKDGSVDMRYKPSFCFLWRASMNAKDYCSCAVRRDNDKAD